MISLAVLLLGVLQLSSAAVPQYQTCPKLWKKLGCRADLHYNLTLLIDDRNKNMVDWDNTNGYEHDLLCRCRQVAVAGGYKWFAAHRHGLCLSKLGDLGSYLREFPLNDQAQCSGEMTQVPVPVPDGSRCIDGRFQPFFYTIETSLPTQPVGSAPSGEAPEEEIEEEIASAPQKQQEENVISSCQTVADVVIVVDTSGSVKQEGIRQTRNFLKSFMNRFDFTEGTRIGIVSYSDDCDKILNWKESAKMSKMQLMQYCDTISGTGGSTRTDLALNCALNIMKESPRAAAAPITVVVMTDGQTWGGKGYVKGPADNLRLAGAKVVSVGIGISVDPEELNVIGGSKDSVFLLSDYSKVTGPQFLNFLIAKSCR